MRSLRSCLHGTHYECVLSSNVTFSQLFDSVEDKTLLPRCDDFVLDVAWDGCVVTELHVGDAAAFGERAELRGEAEELGERDFLRKHRKCD